MNLFNESTGPLIDAKRATQMARFLFLCVVIGAIAGLGAVAFWYMLETTRYLLLDGIAGYHAEGPPGETKLFPPSDVAFNRWLLFLLPAAGGLVCGFIVYYLAPETAGHGTDAAIDAYHYRDGKVRARVPFIKAVSSAITIGTGGSAGREGPIAQIGSGVASIIGERLGLQSHERRTLMAAGMAAGIGAIFHAPLAGALFAAEVLYRDMDIEHEVLVPAFISSVTAYSVFCIFLGWSPIFETPEFVFRDPIHLFPYAILAGVLALGAMVYVRTFYAVHRGFGRLKIPGFLKPAVGGLIVGFIGLFVPRALGTGYGIVQDSLNHELTAPILFLLAFAKILTTSFSVGSGGSGGVFGPSIVIGGALGGAVGLVAEQLLPNANIQAGAFVIVGMAGFFAAAANCPISTIIMVSELTGNFHLLVPSMLVCIVAFLLSRRVSLYERQLPTRLEAPSKMGSMLVAVLRRIDIRQALNLTSRPHEDQALITVPRDMSLGYLIDRYSKSDQPCFPVVDAAARLVGMIRSEDIRPAVGEGVLLDIIVADDIAQPPLVVSPKDTLLAAVTKMASEGSNAIIVVDPENPDRPLAVMSHDRILHAYNKELLESQYDAAP